MRSCLKTNLQKKITHTERHISTQLHSTHKYVQLGSTIMRSKIHLTAVSGASKGSEVGSIANYGR